LLAAGAIITVHGLWFSGQAWAQQFVYRGFADAGVVVYPQEAPNDSTQTVADAQARLDATWRVGPHISLASSIEGRADTHDQTGLEVAFWDRTASRPALAIRTLTAVFVQGPITLELGKQFIRWGQSDILSPTDYFTARDYLIPVSNDTLATTAARVTVTARTTSIEGVYAPRLTPSRMPLLDQRWIGLPAAIPGLSLRDAGADYPGRPQYGVRVRQSVRGMEYSASFFQGSHHLPLLETEVVPAEAAIDVERHYPALRAWGADAVVPLPGIAIKGEAAWLKARDEDADDYGLWVVQGERQQGEWLFIGGYVGEWVGVDRPALRFAPDRGLARSLLGRASRTIGDNRTLFVEAVVRTNGDGLYAKTEYTHGAGAHWRITFQGLLIRGAVSDFLGQYRLNSLTGARARYSF
jgi:hypothetical protein